MPRGKRPRVYAGDTEKGTLIAWALTGFAVADKFQAGRNQPGGAPHPALGQGKALHPHGCAILASLSVAWLSHITHQHTVCGYVEKGGGCCLKERKKLAISDQ